MAMNKTHTWVEANALDSPLDHPQIDSCGPPP